MDKLNVFTFSSYKAYLERALLTDAPRGQMSRAAEALGCQASFLSRVIHSNVQLTPDQAFVLAGFFNMDEDESAYFQTRVESERAGNPSYRTALGEKLKDMKRRREDLSKRANRPDFDIDAQRARYFSSWHWSALHFLTAIPALHSVASLAKRLNLDEKTTLNTLRELQSFGLVGEEKNKWRYRQGQFHLPKSSPFVLLHHSNWRARAVLDAQDITNESIHFTSVLTLSREDLERLKNLVLKFISEAEAVSRPSPPEECAVLNVDLFEI